MALTEAQRRAQAKYVRETVKQTTVRFYPKFWRSVDLTGNQTIREVVGLAVLFWRSVDLTGNQTTS